MFKRKILKLFQADEHQSTLHRYVDYSIMSLIILSTIAIVIESIPQVCEPILIQLRMFEFFTVLVFSCEYVLRLYVSEYTHPAGSKLKSALKFIFSFYGLVDLLAIMPFYLPFIIKTDLKFIRVIRLMRFLRILKINRYNNSLDLIVSVFKEKKAELIMTGFITFMILLIASFLMYYVEGEAQPEKFPNVLASFWWAIATLTTVGYGDIYPITGLGKLISGIIAFMGIGLVALPTGLVSAGFMDKIKQKDEDKKKCPHCGKDIE